MKTSSIAGTARATPSGRALWARSTPRITSTWAGRWPSRKPAPYSSSPATCVAMRLCAGSSERWEVQAGLSHPGIVQVVDQNAEREFPYFVTELGVGGSLRDRLAAAEEGYLDLPAAIPGAGAAVLRAAVRPRARHPSHWAQARERCFRRAGQREAHRLRGRAHHRPTRRCGAVAHPRRRRDGRLHGARAPAAGVVAAPSPIPPPRISTAWACSFTR